MISEETIKILTTKYQTGEDNVRREYYQHLFLSYFYQQPESEHIFFKGGTALRILYNSPRFSEDLDFNSTNINYAGIESLVLETLSQMEKENVKFTLKESSQTTGGFFGTVSCEEFINPIVIEVEISQRQAEKQREVVAVVSDFVPVYNVISVTQKQLVFEKIRALLQRKKPRDFYDLYFLLRGNLLTFEDKEKLAEVLLILQKQTTSFEFELKQFLPKNQWLIIRDFKENLEREIRQHLGR